MVSKDLFSKKPVLSIVLTTLNARVGLETFFSAILSQMKEFERWEFVVVDAGSNDGTWEFLEQISKQNPTIEVYQRVGVNIAQGRNLAIAETSSDFVISVDSGCQLSDDYFKSMLDVFSNDPSIDVVGAATVVVGETPFEQVVANLYVGYQKDVGNPSSRALAFRRAVFDSVGGYDDFSLAGEDTHFNQKWLQQGFLYGFQPKAKVFWRVRPSLFELFKMQRRNAEGDIVFKNRIGVVGWLMRMLPAILVAGLVVLSLGLIFQKEFFVVVGAFNVSVWVLCILYRLLKSKRWRYFCTPLRIFHGIMALAMMDVGSFMGTIKGMSEKSGLLKVRSSNLLRKFS